MSDWLDEIAATVTAGYGEFGIVTTYQRPGFDPFSITGISEFLDRLEDVNSGQFYSLFYRVADFDNATFTASVTVTFSGSPSSGGTLTFDGVTYMSEGTLDNSIPNQFWRAGTALAAAANLAAAINAAQGYQGTSYSAATIAHPTCTATYLDNGDNTADVIVSYKTPGIVGNLITAADHMSFASLDSGQFYGGIPIANDLVTIDGVLYRVSDVPLPDPASGELQIRLEKKAL